MIATPALEPNILNRRAATYRAEALEMTIIILIALEIVLSLLR